MVDRQTKSTTPWKHSAGEKQAKLPGTERVRRDDRRIWKSVLDRSLCTLTHVQAQCKVLSFQYRRCLPSLHATHNYLRARTTRRSTCVTIPVWNAAELRGHPACMQTRQGRSPITLPTPLQPLIRHNPCGRMLTSQYPTKTSTQLTHKRNTTTD